MGSDLINGGFRKDDDADKKIYTRNLNEAINKYLGHELNVIKINALSDNLDLHVAPMSSPDPYFFFSDEHQELSPAKFRRVYSKSKVGMTYKEAYELVTGEKYKYRIMTYLKILLILLIISVVGYGLYYVLSLSFPFLKKEWKWWIPVLLGFIYFSVSLARNNKE